MKRIVIFISGLLVVIALAIAAIPVFLTADFVGEQLQAAVAKQTGRKLTINGGLRFKFWPEVVVEANDVTLSNPPDMLTGQFAAIETLRVKVAALPLLSKQVDIREITLLRPRLGLLVDGQGRENWSFSSRIAKPAEKDPPAATENNNAKPSFEPGEVKLAPIIIRNGDVRYLDERSGSAFAALNVNLAIKIGGLSGPISIKGDLVWNKEKIKLDTFVKSPTTLTGRGSPIDLSIDTRLLNAQFNGRAKLSNGLDLAGTIKTRTPSLRELAAWTGTPMPEGKGLGTFAADAAIDLSGKVIKLSKAKVSLDGMKAQGSLTISLAGARPSIIANVGMDRIDVNQYLASSGKTGPTKNGKASQGDWSDTPIDMSSLKALDARVTIATSQILYKDIVIGKTRVSASLKNGLLNAKLTEMAFYDGKATGQIILSGQKNKPTIQGALNASGLNAFRLLKDFANFKRLEGAGQIQLSLAAAGRSQREMVSTLTGTAKLKFTNGAIRGINIAAMIRNVQKSILGGWDKNDKQSTDFSELSALFKISDGIAKNENLKLIGPLVRVSGAGEIDMLRQRLDYRVKPKLVASLKGQGGAEKLKGIAVPIIIKGPWSKPKIYPDIKGILNNPQAAFNKLSKLISKGGGVDLKKAGKKISKKVEDKVVKKLEETLGTDVDKKKLKKQGKKLFKSLFGSKKKVPQESTDGTGGTGNTGNTGQ